MSLTENAANGVIKVHTSRLFGRRRYDVEVPVRLPYGNSAIDRVRKIFGMESLAEKALRKQLYAISGLDSPHLWATPRSSSGQARYELTTHLREPRQDSKDAPINNDGQRLVREVTVDVTVKKIFTDAFGWTSSEIRRQND